MQLITEQKILFPFSFFYFSLILCHNYIIVTTKQKKTKNRIKQPINIIQQLHVTILPLITIGIQDLYREQFIYCM